MILILIGFILGAIAGAFAKYKNSRLFGIIRYSGIGAFLGLILSLLSMVFKIYLL